MALTRAIKIGVVERHLARTKLLTILTDAHGPVDTWDHERLRDEFNHAVLGGEPIPSEANLEHQGE